jgi:hypothetical protein
MAEIAKNITVKLIKNGANGYRLIILIGGYSSRIISKSLSENELIQIKSRFIKQLKKLRSYWWNGRLENPPEYSDLIESLQEMDISTQNLFCDIFSDEALRSFYDYIRQIREERLPDLISGEIPLGLIEFEANLDEFIPLDYLRIPERNFNRHPKNLNELVLAFSQILGFSFIIYRGCPSRETMDNPVFSRLGKVIHSDDLLAINLFADKDLNYVNREIDFFLKDNAHLFTTNVELPNDYDGPNVTEIFVNKLFEKDKIHFNHFCCHCDTENADAWEHEIRYGQHRFSLKVMRYWYYRNNPNWIRKKCSNTFAFINACGSALVHPFCKSSFPSLFLDYFGHYGFLGPEWKVPDEFAAEFARVLYAHFLLIGHLGLALFKTKWFFAKKYQNPLGLFYALYTNHDIQLSKTINSVNL